MIKMTSMPFSSKILLLFLVGILSVVTVLAQRQEREQVGFDTLHLRLQAKKVVAYVTGTVTILVDYKDFSKEFYPFYKKNAKEMRGYYKEKRKGHAVNTNWEWMFPGLTAFYNAARSQAAISDTIRLEEVDLTRYGFGSAIRFDLLMDEGRCIIEDRAHFRHFMILRKRKAWQSGPLEGWGGRLYFLPGSTEPFYQGTDWRS